MALGALPAQDCLDHPAYSVTISAETSDFISGDPILLRVTATNTSDSRLTVPLGPSGLERDIFQIKVLDEHGVEAAKVDLPPGTPMRLPDNRWASLAPNESITDDLEIGSLYHMESPGAYTVMLYRAQDATNPEGGQICSVILPITIAQASSAKSEDAGDRLHRPCTTASEYTLSIEAHHSRVETKVGEIMGGVEIYVTATNISKHPLSTPIGDKGIDPGALLFNIRYKGGSPAPRRLQPGTPNPTSQYRHSWEVMLPPGKQGFSGIYLNHLFDFSKPGKYTIQVAARPYYSHEPQDTVCSNTIELGVVPAGKGGGLGAKE